MEKNFWNTLPRPVLALAPMVGITDTAFRRVCKGFGADVVYSEMIAADALVRNVPKAQAMLTSDISEYPFVVQLMGKDPRVLAKAAMIVEQHGAAGIDINFGCPAHKIARNECGVMLMRDPEKCKNLIAATIDAVSIPVSIKVRVSIRDRKDTITIMHMLEKIHDLPIAAIMVHGRSFEDSFHGGIRHSVIADVVREFTRGPVLANGGVTSIASSQEILDLTGASGLGLARSVIGKPWVFRQMRDYLTTRSYDEYAWSSVKEIMLKHVELFDATRGTKPFKEIRRHLSHYVRGYTFASEVRQKLVHADSVTDVQNILSDY